MPPKRDGWRILPIVGRRDRPERLVEEAIRARKLGRPRRNVWSEKQALDTLWRIASRNPDTSGGLVVFVDEMGKILEAATRDGSDIYFFQQLAEMASRSDGRLVIVGILHQAFEEYSYRLSREMREEWSKIQGRFIDLPVNTAADEQIAILGGAIDNGERPAQPGPLCQKVAELTNRTTSPDLPELLEACWPLHPVVACLLGPISRRRFGQNQRSVFAFLNSSEPWGVSGFPAAVPRWRALSAQSVVGIPASQLGTIHHGVSRRTPLGIGGGRVGTVSRPSVVVRCTSACWKP